jgi:predicted nucleotide-binding protein (sugar kinase/HSP70/actin superfamily)
MGKKIRISFPNMGYGKYIYYTIYRHLPGIEVVDSPKVTADIVELGIKHSPEFVCFPFKVTLGEFINLRKNYDIKYFIMPIDKGPCRMGFYSPIQERIIKELGYDDITFIPQQQDSLFPETEWLQPFLKLEELTGNKFGRIRLLTNIFRFFFKAKYIEELVELEGLIRCRELNRGDTTRTAARIIKMLDKTEHLISLYRFGQVMRKEFAKIPIDREKKPLRVIISGEIHVLLEQYVNLDIIKRLGEEGVEVHPTFHAYDWILHKIHMNVRRRKLELIGKDFIPIDIGGEAQWDIPAYIEGQRNGFDGFVLLYPFTCMPEVTVRGIIEGQNPDPFYMPAQYFSLDETTAYEGMRTRIESFIDLMKSNRKNNPKFQNKYVEPPELAEIFDKPPRFRRTKAFFKRLAQPFMLQRYIQFFRDIPPQKLSKYYLTPGDHKFKQKQKLKKKQIQNKKKNVDMVGTPGF